MDVVFAVHELEAVQDLIEQHQCRLQTELFSTELEEIFKTWPEKVCDEKYSIRLRCDARVDELGKIPILQLLVVLDLAWKLTVLY